VQVSLHPRRELLCRVRGWGLKPAQEIAQYLVQRLSFAFSPKGPVKRPMMGETALRREAQRFAEEVSTERRGPRPLAFDLPLPMVRPESLDDGDLRAKITRHTVCKARKHWIPKTTLWYQQKRLKSRAPVRVYRSGTKRLASSHRTLQFPCHGGSRSGLQSVGSVPTYAPNLIPVIAARTGWVPTRPLGKCHFHSHRRPAHRQRTGRVGCLRVSRRCYCERVCAVRKVKRPRGP
jgi:hypothetical protein